MKRNPLIPFGIIAVIGILIVTFISFYGAHQFNGQQAASKNDNGQKQTQQQQTASAKPDSIFQQHCSMCHGGNLQGGAGPNLQHIGSKWSKAKILNQIKNGGGGMPGGLISGADAQKVADWLSKKK